jgi:hypothetical protein
MLIAAACATSPDLRALEDARTKDDEAVAANAATLDGAPYAGRWVVVQRGEIVGAAALPDDAVRATESASGGVVHRFVFRPADRGTHPMRLAYVSEGGIVAGRGFLADLGIESGGTPGRPPLLKRKGAARGVDLGRTPRLEIEVSSLDGSEHRTISATFDPDFDGGLLLPRDVAASLNLELYEIPGGADVQVALGRPFRAHRATLVAKVAALQASGLVEAVYETAPLKK